jgi:protoporphyrin/coproporphyrin ferrochelatase
MTFAPEPAPAKGAAPRTAILVCNLGTPEAPTPSAVRRYLSEFLHDPRVVEIPRWIWCFILHGVILRTRPAQSAKRYASVWTPQGSPLTVWTDKQAKLLAGYLGQRGHRITVRFAMRYGAPSIASVLDELKAGGAQRVLVLPMYPQYCAATTGSVCDAVYKWGKRVRSLPELRFINRFHDDPRYIDALVKQLMAHWMTHGRGEKLLMSFHGMPKRTQALGDPYFDECMETARLIALRADVKPENLVVTFQSRLGRAEWLQPYTEPTLVKLAKEGVKKIDVICPGFVADNLETLEEINQEAREAFLKAGGTEFNYVPCLNDQHEWMAALTSLALQHLQGWDTRAPETTAPA